MSDSANFEMLELATGEVILRMAGDEQGYLLKVDFDQKMTGVMGKNKFEICREMMAAGIEALHVVQSKEFPVVYNKPLDGEVSHNEDVKEYFSKEHPMDLHVARVLH